MHNTACFRNLMLKAMAAVLLAFATCAFAMAVAPGSAFASEAPNVTKHTKAEIIDYLAKSDVSVSDRTTYAVAPVPNTVMGELSDETKRESVAMLNNVRYIAGLDEVAWNDEQGQLAQAAAFADNAIRKLTHYPASDGTKPDDMPDDLWQLGIQGAASTNIAGGYSTLPYAIRDGWMDDGDSSNIDRVGHRRWCLNPKMGTTGFGQVNSYTAMYSLDHSASGGQTNVVWPAQLTPVEYFNAAYPWSISIGKTISDPSQVKVTITKQGDPDTTWTFDTISTSAPTSSKSAYFKISNTGYGQTGCIIFRPENFEFKAGDVFHVEASGVNGKTIEYDVEFFFGYPVESVSFPEPDIRLEYNTTARLSTTPPDAKDYEVAWASSDESVVTVSDKGFMTRVAPGNATITATIPGKYTKSGKPVTATANVFVPKSISSDVSRRVSFESRQYTGEAIKPEVTFTDKASGEKLIEGQDYTLTYSGSAIEPGESLRLQVRGINAYCGSYYTTIYVEKRVMNADMVTIAPESFIYSGEPQEPAIDVSYNGTKLEEGTDYTLSVSGDANKTKAGTYRVSVGGAGDHFQGTCYKTYTIDRKQLEDEMLSVDTLEFTYDGSRKSPSVAMSFNDRALVSGADYGISVNPNPYNAGIYTLTVSGYGNYAGTLTREFTIAPAETTVKDGKSVVALGPLTYGQKLSELKVGNNIFVLASNNSRYIYGTFAFDEPDAVFGVGQHIVSWTFTPSSANYAPCKGTLTVTVNKAKPTLDSQPTVADIVYHPTTTLAAYPIGEGSVSVPGTWSWNTPDVVPAVPGGTFECTFTPEDAANYETLSAEIGLNVSKATPFVAEAKASQITYGQALADSTLSGSVQYGESDEAAVSGTFTWVDDTATPNVADGDTTPYEVLFTPNDTSNYESVKVNVTVPVAKADRPATWPSEKYSVAYGVAALSNDIMNLADWRFDDSDIDAELTPGAEAEFTATYVGEDAANYENTTARVIITRSKCEHETTEVRDVKEATCTEEGFTGDTYCTICGEKTLSGQAIEALGHDWDEGAVTTDSTCTKEGERTYTCNRCKETRTEPVEKIAHSWEWKTVEEPTCTKVGTKQQVCSVCNEKGETADIDMVAHDLQWRVAKEPTCAETGLEEQYCTACNQVFDKRDIDKTADHAFGEWESTTKPTCTEAGSEKRVCETCKIEETRDVPAVGHKWNDGEVTTEPTCTAKGVKTFTCENDPTHLKEEPVSALGHDWSAWQTVTEATTSAEGLKERTCARCNEVEQQVIPKLEPKHNPAPTTISRPISPDNPVAAEAVERQITGLTSDSDPAGSTFALLQAKGVAKSKTAVKVSWKRVPGATGYVVYGNKCGKGNKYQKITTVRGTSFTQKKLKKGTYYKYLVVAVKGKAALAAAKTIHVATKGGKVGNAKSVKTKAKKKVKLKKGKKLKLKAKAVPQSKKLKVRKHRAIAYDTTNPSVATVTKKGVVQARKPGTCVIYAYAQNGVCKAVKVTVK